jgi:hypothetical protein
MDAGINNVIYIQLHLGPKMANSTCGKTIVAGTIDRGSTVLSSVRLSELKKKERKKERKKWKYRNYEKAAKHQLCVVQFAHCRCYSEHSCGTETGMSFVPAPS